MTLLPRTMTSWETLEMAQAASAADGEEMDTSDDNPSSTAQQILVTNQSGAISLITNLTTTAATNAADSYRTLSALQTYLSSTLPHPLGLNSKPYRNVEVDMSVGGRAVLDGNVLRRWMELGSWKRAEGVTRIGCEGEWEVLGLLEGIGGRGLGYL